MTEPSAGTEKSPGVGLAFQGRCGACFWASVGGLNYAALVSFSAYKLLTLFDLPFVCTHLGKVGFSKEAESSDACPPGPAVLASAARD